MTAIIIVVVVALVFFVSICVITFMVWKHETEMRTDSLKAIEQRLEVLGNRLAESGDTSDKAEAEDLRASISRITQNTDNQHMFRKRSADPFSWMRSGRENAENEHSGENREIAIIEEIEEHEKYDMAEMSEPVDMTDYEIQEEEIEEEISSDMDQNYTSEDYKERERIYAEIDLDFAEIRNIVSEMKKTEEEQLPEPFNEQEQEPAFDEIQLPDLEVEEDGFNEVMKTPMQYDVGRSGRKYTATELETLIKE